MHEEPNPYVTASTVTTALAAIILLMLGWLFGLVVNKVQDIDDTQEITQERVIKNETHISHLNTRMNRVDARAEQERFKESNNGK